MGSSRKLKKAILFSGGIDSTALLFWKKPDYAFFVNYGQKALKGELRAAKTISSVLGINLIELKVGFENYLDGWERYLEHPSLSEWLPYRNQLLITIAGIKAIELDVKTLLVGSVKSDSQYKDGTKDFFLYINKLMAYQEGEVKVIAPAINYHSIELIKKSQIDSSILAWAHSCTQSHLACGLCPSCHKHQLIMKNITNIYY